MEAEMGTKEYRKGYEDMKKEINEEREGTAADIPEKVVKGIIGLPISMINDLTRNEDEEKGRQDALDGKDFDPPEEKSSSPCFISTACIKAKGLPDNCNELKILREFRDNYLLKSREGEKLVNEYYRLSPKIVDILRSKDNSNEVFCELYYSLVLKSIKKIKAGKNKEAIKLYKNIVCDLAEKNNLLCK